MIHKTGLLFLLLLPLLSTTICAQRALEVRMGSSLWYAKDEIISESIFSGNIPALWLGFESTSPHKKIRIQSTICRGIINSAYNHQWELTSLSLSFAHDVSLSRKTNFQQYIPIEFVANTLLAKSTYFSNGEEYVGRTSGFGNIQLASGYYGYIRLPNSINFNAGIRVPLIGYGYRSGYSILTPDNLLGRDITLKNVLTSGKIIHFFSDPSAIGNIRFSKKVSQHWTLTLAYTYSFVSSGSANSFKSVNQDFTGGVQWVW